MIIFTKLFFLLSVAGFLSTTARVNGDFEDFLGRSDRRAPSPYDTRDFLESDSTFDIRDDGADMLEIRSGIPEDDELLYVRELIDDILAPQYDSRYMVDTEDVLERRERRVVYIRLRSNLGHTHMRVCRIVRGTSKWADVKMRVQEDWVGDLPWGDIHFFLPDGTEANDDDLVPPTLISEVVYQMGSNPPVPTSAGVGVLAPFATHSPVPAATAGPAGPPAAKGKGKVTSSGVGSKKPSAGPGKGKMAKVGSMKRSSTAKGKGKAVKT